MLCPCLQSKDAEVQQQRERAESAMQRVDELEAQLASMQKELERQKLKNLSQSAHSALHPSPKRTDSSREK